MEITQEKENIRISLDKLAEPYDIIIGQNLNREIASHLRRNLPAARYAIITDSNIADLSKTPHIQNLEDELASIDLKHDTFVIPAGEENKRAEKALEVINQMVKSGFGRDSLVIARGGGVIGDMAGWIAGNYLRGVPFIQTPTSLLAMADASIGGKVGVDTADAKNAVGLFYQPKIVFIDLDTLGTLPQEELVNGMSETIKHAVINDDVMFKYLHRKMGLILKRDMNELYEVSLANCRIKGEVVEKDPKEKGLRQILNYGHTVGHAIEKLSGYKIPHGHCVSIGMNVAGRIANKVTGFSWEDIAMQTELIVAAGLPLQVPDCMTNQEIIEQTLLDKKARNGRARYVLPVRIGTMADFNGRYSTEVDSKIVESALDACR